MIIKDFFELEDFLEEVRTFSAKHPGAYWDVIIMSTKLRYSFYALIDEGDDEDTEFSFTVPICHLHKNEVVKNTVQQYMIACSAASNAKKEFIDTIIDSTETMREKLLMH